MRNFKIKKRIKPIFISKAAFVNVTLLAGIAIFVGLAAATGKLVSDNISTGNNNPADKVVISSGASQTEDYTTVKIDAQDYYFLQFGVFSNKENANKCADSISQKGGAGYIKEIEGKNYVFAMSYSQSDDARTVITQLKDQGYSAILKCYSHGGLSINLSGSKTSIDNVEKAFEGISKIPLELESVIYNFDKNMYDREELNITLDSIKEKIATYKDVFNTYSDQNDIFSQAVLYCNSVCEDISDIIKIDNETSPSSKLKFIYINCIFNLIEYLDNVVIA